MFVRLFVVKIRSIGLFEHVQCAAALCCWLVAVILPVTAEVALLQKNVCGSVLVVPYVISH